jgi:hypothetical protein
VPTSYQASTGFLDTYPRALEQISSYTELINRRDRPIASRLDLNYRKVCMSNDKFFSIGTHNVKLTNIKAFGLVINSEIDEIDRQIADLKEVELLLPELDLGFSGGRPTDSIGEFLKSYAKHYGSKIADKGTALLESAKKAALISTLELHKRQLLHKKEETYLYITTFQGDYLKFTRSLNGHHRYANLERIHSELLVLVNPGLQPDKSKL